MQGFDGRAAVITGSTGRLGAVVVRRFLEAGAHVAIPVRDLTKGASLRASLGELATGKDGPRLSVGEADPGDAAAMERFVEATLRLWGRLDVLVTIAGGYGTNLATDGPAIEALWRQNVMTAVNATAACLAPMRARGYGRIVIVSSQAALLPTAKQSGYGMAKSALDHWSTALALEVGRDAITANSVLPGSMGPLQAGARRVTHDEVANAILFLASEEASGVNGATISMPGR